MAMKIGEKIREYRKAKNISQEALASLLGVTFQAVSKWETNTTTPDLSLIPSLAHYFGVSIDDLFDYHVFENEQIIDGICREAVRCRDEDPVRAEKILREGFKQFPANEKLLTVLMYILCSVPDRDADLIEACRRLIACTGNEGVRCDALRILAEAYHSAGEFDQIASVLEQIPEFYFTKLECVAKLTQGKESLDAAQFQMNLSGQSVVGMLKIMSTRYAELGDQEKSSQCTRIADGILSVFRSEDGKGLEISGYEWVESL